MQRKEEFEVLSCLKMFISFLKYKSLNYVFKQTLQFIYHVYTSLITELLHNLSHLCFCSSVLYFCCLPYLLLVHRLCVGFMLCSFSATDISPIADSDSFLLAGHLFSCGFLWRQGCFSGFHLPTTAYDCWTMSFTVACSLCSG